jgi:hypothetical protein
MSLRANREAQKGCYCSARSIISRIGSLTGPLACANCEGSPEEEAGFELVVQANFHL